MTSRLSDGREVTLEELDRLHIEFLGMVSHEFRAPQASIMDSMTTLPNAPRAVEWSLYSTVCE